MVVQRDLLSGEHVVWQGRPAEGLVLRPSDVFLIPFSLLWLSFAVFWNANVWSSEAPIFFKLFGLPFLIIGVFMAVGRFWVDRANRRKLYYLVTNRRIVILKSGGASASRSLDIKRLPIIELEEQPDGTGSIRFGASGGFLKGNNYGTWLPSFDAVPQFIGVDKARAVYELILQNAA